jgi:hypothetical protein
MKLELALKLCALVHLGLIVAGGLMPFATGLWSETKRLSPFAARLFRVYYAFIGLCLFSFGAASWIFAAELASGTAFARAVCAFLAVFWTIRLIAAGFLDVRPYLVNGWWRLGYTTTNIVFSLLPFVYGWGALPHP